jgi:23S rRNA (adenine2503-C2)-methyltransferase
VSEQRDGRATGPQANLLDLSYVALQAQMELWSEPRFRTQQLWQWLYVHLATEYDQMTNLPLSLRERLEQFYRLKALTPVDELRSSDGLTEKLLFELYDGARIESVGMAYDQRWTVCVSSQVGCAVGCSFCATGQGGFVRHLEVGEIVEQVLYFDRRLRAAPEASAAAPTQRAVSNIVLMGMGEPLLNYDRVWQAIEIWNDHRGFDLGARRITVSTVGVVPGILRLAGERLQVGLAVSIHAADDELRDQLVPLNKRYPLAELMDACHEYVAQTRRRVTIEYCLIEEINDAASQAHQLARLLHGLNCHVNLIPLNPDPSAPDPEDRRDRAYRPSPRQRVRAFQRVLTEQGIPTTVRLRRGIDIQAGCGQLRQRYQLRSGEGLSNERPPSERPLSE